MFICISKFSFLPFSLISSPYYLFLKFDFEISFKVKCTADIKLFNFLIFDLKLKNTKSKTLNYQNV